jgi:hypothetical protein
MKTITLQQAQGIVNDPEAVKRGYITPQTLVDAEELAKEAISLPTFCKPGFLYQEIGSPDNWWRDNSSVYCRLSDEPRYQRDRNFSHLLLIADYLTLDARVEALESRLTALKILRGSLSPSQLTEIEDISTRLTQIEESYAV